MKTGTDTGSRDILWAQGQSLPPALPRIMEAVYPVERTRSQIADAVGDGSEVM